MENLKKMNRPMCTYEPTWAALTTQSSSIKTWSPMWRGKKATPFINFLKGGRITERSPITHCFGKKSNIAMTESSYSNSGGSQHCNFVLLVLNKLNFNHIQADETHPLTCRPIRTLARSPRMMQSFLTIVFPFNTIFWDPQRMDCRLTLFPAVVSI